MNAALFDYGAGNLHSLAKGLEGAGVTVTITDDWDTALSLDALVLPGVGAFGAAATALGQARARVRAALEGGLPCLGICLGMQLFFDGSEEAAGAGIGVMEGAVRRIPAAVVPQMGWNDVDVAVRSGVTDPPGEAAVADPLFAGVPTLVAYYANSYVCAPADEATIIAWSEYDGVRYPAAVRKDSTWGVQFHPEKSSASGRRILANWARLAGGGR